MWSAPSWRLFGGVAGRGARSARALSTGGGGGGVEAAPLVGDAERARFRRDGFLLIPSLIPRAQAERLRGRYAALFAGDFPTKQYPDEWHWREGISREDVTREICNGWKCDREVAAVALSEALGRR